MKLIGPFKQLLPMTGISLKGAIPDNELIVIENGAILIEGEKIYAVGGFFNGVGQSAVEEYNPALDTWTTKASLPTARSGLAVGVVGGGGGLPRYGCGIDESVLRWCP